ncbi:MAG: SET domain-containing protein [Ilumatobacteraceae bacterium]
MFLGLGEATHGRGEHAPLSEQLIHVHAPMGRSCDAAVVRFTCTVLEPPTDLWIHPDVRVAASPIAGQGLFVKTPAPAGTVVLRFGGRLVRAAELRLLLDRAQADAAYVDTIAVDDDTHLVLPAGTIAHYGNHSCDPTTWLDPPFELVARRDLTATTELTIDYGVVSDDPAFHMQCRCGASGCRQVVTGSDWRQPDLRTSHCGHWPRSLRRRIEGDRASE